MRNLKKIVLIGFILINLNAVSFNLKNISIDEISSSKEWRQLLYFNKESEIKDKKYFLSEIGNLDPKAELLATINAYKEENSDNDPVCLFPARYYFLSKYISFPKYKKINDGCTNLKKWQPIKNTDNISLVLVSGYISNPASTFGHSLIKLNNKESGLFDTSINYGALVPDNENTLTYIYKGLTGGYEAGFSDKYFYEQDLMYSNKEYRDMWEYKLNLTSEQKDLMLLHLYEILTRKFDYYFLSRNCGYRVSEILNLVSNEKSINQDLWYLPVETFDFLETKEKELIKGIKYIPSNKKVFNSYFEKLTEKEKLGVKEFIRNNTLLELNEEEKIHVLDFLLIYYKNTLNIYPEKKEIRYILRKVILERLKLKPSEKQDIEIEQRISPAKNTNPIDLKIGYGYKSTIVSLSPYKQNFLDKTNIGYDELTFFNTMIGIKDKLYLKHLDFIKIQKVNSEKTELLNDNLYSWKINLGVEQSTYYVTSGVGYFIDQINMLGMIDLEVNSKEEIDLVPHVNFYNKFFDLKNQIEIGYKDKSYVIDEIQYNISNKKNIGLKLEYSEKEYNNLVYLKINF
jgi:hypothetical protein